ncbi:HEPN domain-containing protein [Pseudomonas sp. Ost2]|uniref:HEPN domain-containing protein n=1 Tax=Pseudomonas sp. Ost2 TaxID=2678260 RepID=UPI001FD1BAFB|nr:HEPN domain-containing protein [Pseudomonas sp. Ost2]
MFMDKKINLNKDYEFRVSVEGSVGSFSAVLKLSQNAISIRISGDQVGLRMWGDAKWELESLECAGNGWNYLLFDLHCAKSGSYIVGEMPGNAIHFEIEYTAKYAVISRQAVLDMDFRSIHLYSPSLAKWVGYTEKQQEIIEDQVSGSRVGLVSNFDNFDTTEFCIDDEDGGQIALNYNIKANASPFEFEVGIRFPLSFCVFKNCQINPVDTLALYQKCYSLLSLLHGQELVMDRIELWEDDAKNGEAFIYYPKPAPTSNDYTSYSWYPLGHKLRFNDLGLSPFPLESISKYFSESYEFSEKWAKYLKYRRMSSVEERFLGYFRLLESLTKKTKSFLDPDLLSVQVERVEKLMIKIFGCRKEVKSFLRGVGRYNETKYNTEKCMIDFYKKLPVKVVGGWRLKQESIKSICKLRNDISHANDYFETDDEILAKCTFVESLLMVSLLETVGVSISSSSSLIFRMPGAHNLNE